MSLCILTQKRLCGKEDCDICFNKSFASYNEKTQLKKSKVDCWDIEKNRKSPREVFKNSNKKYWFQCDVCHHSFQSALNNIMNSQWCPYCCLPSRLLCKDKKCSFCFEKTFASYNEKTILGKRKVDCWDIEKNIKSPREVFKSSGNKYWFQCDVCHHSFQSALSNIMNSCWCPYCTNKTEGKFKHWFIQEYKHKIKRQPRYSWCKSPDTNRYLPFDFVIEDLKLIIEIDGRQHFQQVWNWKCPEYSFEYDEYKMKKAMKHGYSMIRILQEDIYMDKNDWEKEFKHVLQDYEIETVPTIVCIGCEIIYKKYNSVKDVKIRTDYYSCDSCEKKFYFMNNLESHTCK